MRAPRLRLSHRLFLLTAAALLPALGILAFNEVSLRQARAAELQEYVERLSEQASLEMERIVTGAAAMMVAVATVPIVQQMEIAACSSYLRNLHDTVPQVNILVVADRDERVVCASSEYAVASELMAESSDVTAALETSFFAVGHHVQVADATGLSLGTKILGNSGSVEGYVLAVIGLDYLGQIVKERSFSAGSALTIADRNGVILAREPLPERFVGTRIPEAYRHLVHAPESGSVELLSQDGVRRIVGYQPASDSGLGLYVSAGVSVDDAFGPINDAFYRGIALAVAGAIMAFGLAFFFGRRFVQAPVGLLLATIGNWRSGKRDARTNMRGGTAEFHLLGTAIDEMLDEIEERQTLQEQAEAHRDLLARELNHRVKNLLATVQAVARQTFKSDHSSRALAQVFTGRLQVLADAHNLLVDQQQDSAELSEVMHVAVAPFEEEQGARFHLNGETLVLKPKAALSLAMALHELCTNAAKYGALSTQSGRVHIDWNLRPEDQLLIVWSEAGGPPVAQPRSTGFGSQLISRALQADLGASVEVLYEPDGFICRIAASASWTLVHALGEN